MGRPRDTQSVVHNSGSGSSPTRLHHLTRSLAFSLQVDPWFFTISSSHMLGGRSDGLFDSGFQSMVLFAHLSWRIRAICPAHLSFFTFITCRASIIFVLSLRSSFLSLSLLETPRILLSMALWVIAISFIYLDVSPQVSAPYVSDGKIIESKMCFLVFAVVLLSVIMFLSLPYAIHAALFLLPSSAFIEWSLVKT